MRLALMIEGQEDVTWEDWRALAAACEEHGVHALFRSDHYLSVSGRRERGSLDAWGTISALGPLTRTLRLGTMVSPATFRHPSILAKAVATADHLSGGRVEVGMGTGWLEAEHVAYGFPFGSMAERMERLREQLEIVRGQWDDGPFSHHGRHYEVERLDALPKPLQRPRPPLILGGRGGPRSIRLAAELADEYNTVYKTAGELAEIRRRLDAAGGERVPLSVMTGWLVAEDREALAERAARLSRWQGGDGDGEAFLAGVDPSWIVGTADEAREQLSALADAGVERVMAQHLLHRDVAAVELVGALSD